MSKYLKYLISYHVHVGTVAWLLMRLCGVVLTIYLGCHLGIIFWFGKNSASFTTFLQISKHPGMRILETFFIWAACYHGGNGIRLILMDLGLGIRWQKSLFIVIIMLSLILTIFFVYLR